MSRRIYSDSILDAFSLCFAKGEDALGERHAKVGPAKQGQAFHAFAARYVERLWSTSRLSDAEHGRELWNSIRWQLSPEDDAGITPAVERFLLEDLPFVLEARGPPVVEVRRWYKLGGAQVRKEDIHLVDEPLFAMTPDVWWVDQGGVMHVLDWKTGWSIEALEEPRERRQMLRYAAALSTRIRAVVPHTYHVRHRWHEVGEPFTPDELEQAWQDLVVTPIRALERMFESGDTPRERTVGPHCASCDLRNGCEAFARFAPIVPEFGDGPALLTALAVTQAREADLHMALRAHMELAGGIQTEDFEAKLSTTSEWTWDDDRKLKGALLRHVHRSHLRTMFRATKSSIERGLALAGINPAKRGMIMNELYALGRVKQRSRITVGRKTFPRSQPLEVLE